MATLTAAQLTGMRNLLSTLIPVNYDKTLANTTFQAIENWETSALTVLPTNSLSAAIDVATAPTVLTNAQKQDAFWCWCALKAHQAGLV